MGTSAVFTFTDSLNNKYHVYKHWDGNPTIAIECIKKALSKAWPLPRFEADDFAAAFVAANKPDNGGDIRLCHSYEDFGDLEYRYDIFMKENKLTVIAWEVSYNEQDQLLSKRLKVYTLN